MKAKTFLLLGTVSCLLFSACDKHDLLVEQECNIEENQHGSLEEQYHYVEDNKTDLLSNKLYFSTYGDRLDPIWGKAKKVTTSSYANFYWKPEASQVIVGDKSSMLVHCYNQDGFLIREEWWFPIKMGSDNFELEIKLISEKILDDRNRVTESLQYGNSFGATEMGITGKIEITYDDNNKEAWVLQYEYYEGNYSLSSKAKYRLKSNGRIDEDCYTIYNLPKMAQSGLLPDINYEIVKENCDKHNNWAILYEKITEYDNLNKESIRINGYATREIEYY